jgi:hypothetical protein
MVVPNPNNAGNLDGHHHFGIARVRKPPPPPPPPPRTSLYGTASVWIQFKWSGSGKAQSPATVSSNNNSLTCFGLAVVSSMARSSFAATLALASASRLRAPRTSPPSRLLTTPSGAPSKNLQSTPRSRGPPSATRSSADHGRSAPRQQTSPTTPLSPPLSRASSSSHTRRPLLQPYELSRRLIGLCQQGDVDLAVTALQQAPRNAQNIKVWNTIIQQCMDAKKYNLAYSVFTDVRPQTKPFPFVLPTWLT